MALICIKLDAGSLLVDSLTQNLHNSALLCSVGLADLLTTVGITLH